MNTQNCLEGTHLACRLAAQASRAADREAIVHGERRVTYGDLWREAQKVAAWLQAIGLRRGDRVALLMDNSPDYAAAYYGVLLAGGAVVALNTAVKAPEIVNWIRHSEAHALIADARHAELPAVLEAAPESLAVLVLGKSRQPLPRPVVSWDELPVADDFVPATTRDDDLGAIIYTSGTTGAPKGVMLSHGNLAANLDSILAYLRLTEADSIVNVLPFYYSYGNSVLHTHLAVGGRLILENSLMYPHKVVERIVSERATGFSGVPSTFALLLSRVDLQQYDLSGLRYITQAGGAMPPAHTRRLRQILGETDIVIMYGQTEATARIAWLPPERIDDKPGSCGKAIPGVEVEIRDENDQPVPPGTVGEICVRGANIMQGYWRNPEATAEVVVDGWLHTGDLARMDEEGFLFIEGRSSDMIKAGANRISPQEIEEVIQELEAVAEAGVVGVPDEILGEAIKAVVVPRQGVELDKRTILAHCRQRLALYKIPKFVEFAEALPKTASGKIRRYLLNPAAAG